MNRHIRNSGALKKIKNTYRDIAYSGYQQRLDALLPFRHMQIIQFFLSEKPNR